MTNRVPLPVAVKSTGIVVDSASLPVASCLTGHFKLAYLQYCATQALPLKLTASTWVWHALALQGPPVRRRWLATAAIFQLPATVPLAVVLFLTALSCNVLRPVAAGDWIPRLVASISTPGICTAAIGDVDVVSPLSETSATCSLGAGGTQKYCRRPGLPVPVTFPHAVAA